MSSPIHTPRLHAAPTAARDRTTLLAVAASVVLSVLYLGASTRPLDGIGPGVVAGAVLLYVLLEAATQAASRFRTRGHRVSPLHGRATAAGRRAALPIVVFGVHLNAGAAAFLGWPAMALASLAILGLALATAVRLVVERHVWRTALNPMEAP